MSKCKSYKNYLIIITRHTIRFGKGGGVRGAGGIGRVEGVGGVGGVGGEARKT